MKGSRKEAVITISGQSKEANKTLYAYSFIMRRQTLTQLCCLYKPRLYLKNKWRKESTKLLKTAGRKDSLLSNHPKTLMGYF